MDGNVLNWDKLNLISLLIAWKELLSYDYTLLILIEKKITRCEGQISQLIIRCQIYCFFLPKYVVIKRESFVNDVIQEISDFVIAFVNMPLSNFQRGILKGAVVKAVKCYNEQSKIYYV